MRQMGSDESDYGRLSYSRLSYSRLSYRQIGCGPLGRGWLLSGVLVGGMLAGLSGCSSAGENPAGAQVQSGETNTPGAGGPGGDVPGGETPGAGVPGGSGDEPGGGLDIPMGAGDDTGPTTPQSSDEACAEEVGEGTPVPPVIQFVVDTSGSMGDEPAPGQPPKWETTRDALIAALQAMPQETPVGMFTFPGRGGGGGSCLRTEGGVDVAPLADGNLQEIQDLLENLRVSGGTPTHDAFTEGQQRVSAAEYPGKKFIVLLTDGVPTYAQDCNGDGQTQVDAQPIVNAAAAAAATQVGTFVIGSPGSEGARAALSATAQQGGTGAPTCAADGPEFCHFDMTTEPNFDTALTAALAAITEQTFDCSYAVPTPSSGRIDPEKVNVRFTGSDGQAVPILKDPSATDCNGGWQFSADRSRVELCQDTCELAKGDPTGSIEILFGCTTDVR